VTDKEIAAYQRLEALQRQLEQQLGPKSRGVHDLAQVGLSPELLEDVQTCISSNDHLAIGSGLYVLKGLLIERRLRELPKGFVAFLRRRIVDLLSHPSDALVFDAIDWFGQLREFYPDYRDRMLSFLASNHPGRRAIALRYFPTYAAPGEVEPLLRFRTDDYMTELEPLGDWEYELRNRALDLIEQQVGTTFPRTVRSEPHDGARVTWYDWTPFTEWWLKNRSDRGT
jgi:hypothetical protein